MCPIVLKIVFVKTTLNSLTTLMNLRWIQLLSVWPAFSLIAEMHSLWSIFVYRLVTSGEHKSTSGSSPSSFGVLMKWVEFLMCDLERTTGAQ